MTISKVYTTAFTLLLLNLVSACTQEEDLMLPEEEQKPLYPNVEEALYQYFSRFEEEARARGFNYDLTNLEISASIEEIEQEHIAGQCACNRFRSPRKVTIDRSFWNRASDLYKEFIIFHELGHCVLDRRHLESSLPNGACASIMRSGNSECLDNYDLLSRDFYVDELFTLH